MFLSLDGTFFVQLVNFAIFFALLNVLFLHPVGRAIRKRREYINGVTSDYERYQTEAKTLREQSERLRAQARREAQQAIAKARAEASNATAELAGRYAAMVQQVVEEANHEVAGELAGARANAKQVVLQLANLMVDRALTETVR